MKRFNSPVRPSVTPSVPGSTPPSHWGQVAGWYDQLLQDQGSAHHQKVIIPGVLRMLEATAGQRILDIACGQGAVCRAIARKGARVLGVDAADALIQFARDRCEHPELETYICGDARKLPEIQALGEATFDAAICVLAIQNMTPLSPIWQGCRRLLKTGGHLIVVMVHPCFRVPHKSSWQWDEKLAAQYRRIDSYLTSEKVPISMHPGSSPETTTLTFHRPLQAYVNTLGSAGLLIDHLEEWTSHKLPPAGKRFDALDRSRKEFPLFLALRARAV